MEQREKYRMICPECGAAVLTGYPDAVVWEICPACKHHVWDIYDARMADRVNHQVHAGERSSHAEN